MASDDAQVPVPHFQRHVFFGAQAQVEELERENEVCRGEVTGARRKCKELEVALDQADSQIHHLSRQVRLSARKRENMGGGQGRRHT